MRVIAKVSKLDPALGLEALDGTDQAH